LIFDVFLNFTVKHITNGIIGSEISNKKQEDLESISLPKIEDTPQHVFQNDFTLRRIIMFDPCLGV
jgi:hypothetical protein